MRLAIDRNDQMFLDRLHKMCGGTIQEICDAIGVTATAIRQRLARLEGHGLVVRELVRAGRGRPHHVYRVSDEGLRHLGENYRELALVLWRALHQVTDSAAKTAIMNSVREGLVREYGRVSISGSLPDRMQQLRDELNSHGFDVEFDDAGQLPVLRENSCPYQDLATADPSICAMEAQVFRQILNADVELTQCCLDGHGSCEFQVQESLAGELPAG